MLAVGGPADPRRRHPDPGAQAGAVRAGDGVGAEGARHQGGRRRPPDADRADRRAGPDGARRFHLPAGRRSGAGRRAQVAADRARRRSPAGAGAEAQGLAVAGAARRAPPAMRLSMRRPSSCAAGARGPSACRRSSSTPALLDGEGMRTRMLQAAGTGGGRADRRVPQQGAGLRCRRAADAARVSRLAARGQPRDQARHGAGPRRGARHDRARRQGAGGADRVPAGHLLDAIGAAAGRAAAAGVGDAAVGPAAAVPVAGEGHEQGRRRAVGQGAMRSAPRPRSATACSTWP